MQELLIKTLNYQPQEYLELRLNEPIENKGHMYFLQNPNLLNCFIHLNDASCLYFDTQSVVTLEYYLKHHSITKKEIKLWTICLLEQIEVKQDGYCLWQISQIFVDEGTAELKFCVIPMQYPQEVERVIVEFILALYEQMNYDDDEEWISQLYLLVKQRPFRFALFKQFMMSKKTKRWLSFFKKEDEELSSFFKMIQVQESHVSYGLKTVPFETQVLMAGYQYGYLLDPYQHKVLITNSKWIIGRQKDCDYVLDFPEVSKQHCQIVIENGSCCMVDLDSTNGTKLNDERLISNQPYSLKDLDEIVIAGHKFVYYA